MPPASPGRCCGPPRPCADVTAFLSSLLRETDVLVTLNPREQIETLLAGCGNPRVVDLRFAAEFFLPQADSTALKPLWEHLHGKPREKFSFTAREAVELSLDLVRHICGRVLNPAEFPPAAALRFHLGRSDTLFGDLFLHLNRNFRDYFGGLFDPSAGGETPDWKAISGKGAAAGPACRTERRHGRRSRSPGSGISTGGLPPQPRDMPLRPSQIAYAGHVASALNDGAVLTIEAGTGTGKTQGYLIPVLEFLRRNPDARVAVSTYTKNLQEQIVRREIPLTVSLNRAYRKIPTALLKGKSNYLCAEKLDHLYDDALSGGRLLAWLYFVNRVFHFRQADGDAVGERVRFHLNDGLFFRRLQHEISARSGCTPEAPPLSGAGGRRRGPKRPPHRDQPPQAGPSRPGRDPRGALRKLRDRRGQPLRSRPSAAPSGSKSPPGRWPTPSPISNRSSGD